jgi:hypothetical protein
MLPEKEFHSHPYAWVPAGSGVGREAESEGNRHRTDSNKESPVLEGHPQDRAEKTRLAESWGYSANGFKSRSGLTVPRINCGAAFLRLGDA